MVPHEPAQERAVPEQFERSRRILEDLLLEIKIAPVVEEMKIT